MNFTDKHRAYVEELLCDCAAGEFAGENNCDTRLYEDLISTFPGCDSHPDGKIRLDFYTKSKQLAAKNPLKAYLPLSRDPIYQRKKNKMLEKMFKELKF